MDLFQQWHPVTRNHPRPENCPHLYQKPGRCNVSITVTAVNKESASLEISYCINVRPPGTRRWYNYPPAVIYGTGVQITV
jgi:hypothetical protein